MALSSALTFEQRMAHNEAIYQALTNRREAVKAHACRFHEWAARENEPTRITGLMFHIVANSAGEFMVSRGAGCRSFGLMVPAANLGQTLEGLRKDWFLPESSFLFNGKKYKTVAGLIKAAQKS